MIYINDIYHANPARLLNDL